MLPPATALWRFLYQNETLQGSPVPASAFILWPFQPRTQPDGKYAVVAWAHGTAGVHENCAPSNTKTLWQHWLAPFPLALHGYVTFAPDYAGLGVGRTADGNKIIHQYMANPAQANDIVFGGAAWAVAQRQAQKPVKGYLGAVAVSPIANILELPTSSHDRVLVLSLFAKPTMQQLYPDFDQKDFFTDKGWERYQLEDRLGSFTPVLGEVMTSAEALQDNWRENTYLQRFVQLTAAGGKEIGGSLLVIQGAADEGMDVDTTTDAVNKARKAFPDAQLQYVLLPGFTHLPTIYAAQRFWLDWSTDRFRGVEVHGGYQERQVEEPPRPLESYQKEPSWTIDVERGRFLLNY
ncbi:MAG: hypothetical protein Q9180_007570 [Flavoplaca navasiana]